MAQVFVSYSRKDLDFVNELIDYCEAQGIEFWRDVDTMHAGDKWMDEIDRGIANAYAVIVIWSPDARKSEYVAYEWIYAWGQGKAIVPIMLETTDLFPAFRFHCLDFKNGQRDWAKLITDLNTARARYSEKIIAPETSTPALRDAVKILNSSLTESELLAALAKVKEGMPQQLEEGRQVLAQALEHAIPRISLEAARILVDGGSASEWAKLSRLISTEARLHTLLRLQNSNTRNVLLCQRICSTISNIQSARMLRPLTHAFDNSPNHADVQQAIVTAMGNIAAEQAATEKAIAELARILPKVQGNRPNVFTAVVTALRKINSEASRRVLTNAGL
jgi:TIR domain